LLPQTVLASTFLITNNDGGVGGDLNNALQQAEDGDIIDFAPIAGQTIFLTTPLPAIGRSAISSTPSLAILGNGVIIDGGNTHPAFSLAQGSATISDLTIQNATSKGGAGGSGFSGAGGGTAGGGALYVHSGTSLTISAVNLNNNQAIGGAGGTGTATGGSGGGGGGYGGGTGGSAVLTGASAGSGGGGGGNNGGTAGGRDGHVASPNPFTNFAGAGGGGSSPGVIGAKSGGTNACLPAKTGGSGGVGSLANAAGAGGGGGCATSLSPTPPQDGSGFSGFNAIDAISLPQSGVGGAGGYGFGAGYTYGAGGGGGGGNGGGAGFGTSGGGGGYHGPGGNGGAFGGGGGGSNTSTGGAGGSGGFGAGGGGGKTGGTDSFSLGGAGGSATNLPTGGGGGSGLGGAIIIQEGALLTIQDNTNFSGNSVIAGIGGTAASGGVSGGNGSALGQDIFVQSGGGLTFQINSTLTFPNAIAGAGTSSGPGVIKSGIGTVYLNGAQTYLNNTSIQMGTLNLNGSVIGDINIETTGMLSGNAIASGNINNSGKLLPGNSIGTINTTNLFLNPTSVYNVEVNSAGASDLINASGSAQVDGGIVVIPDDFNYTAPVTYTIISTSSGVTGKFSALTSSTPALMSLIYNPLTVQLTYLPLNSIGLTGNAFNTASSFFAVPIIPASDATTIHNLLLASSFATVKSAFEQMDPAQFSGLTNTQLLNAILVRSTYSKHLQEFCCNKEWRHRQSTSFWIDGIGQWQNEKNQFGYRDTGSGTTIGADFSAKNWTLGGALSLTRDTFHLKNLAIDASINSYYGGIYGSWKRDEFFLNMSLLGAYNNYNTKRKINFATIDRQAKAKHEGNDWLTHFGLGYQLGSPNFQLTPYINLDLVQQHERGYTETGAGSLDLQVHKKNATLFQGEAGIVLCRTYHTENGEFIPQLTLAYLKQSPWSSKNYRANFTNSPVVFTNKGENYERNLFAPRLDLTYKNFSHKAKFSFYYGAKVSNGYLAQNVGLDLTFHF